ncbi:c-type cytochrome [Archangium primigenium]|uniref:c-type cytochrome n=1 Tax=[Archangium] primigenium TaxID=2792470 RepID=UPI001EF7D152|nr:cytochrome C [Archangium primigenium]
MNARKTLGIAALGALGLSLGAASAADTKPPAPAKHEVPRSADGNVVVALCDGQTTLEVKGVKDPAAIDRTQAQAISDRLMAEWHRKNPQANWDPVPVKVALAQKPAAPNPPTPPPASKAPATPGGDSAASDAAAVGQKQGEAVQSGHTYGAYSARDEALWKASAEQMVTEGHRVFHDAKSLGSTVAVSCDMCHPDAANTHPETYPKYQVQLGRTALLRDMINWCIENPVRGKPMAEDDPRMKAMEAYILAQRKGVKLEYGKH